MFPDPYRFALFILLLASLAPATWAEPGKPATLTLYTPDSPLSLPLTADKLSGTHWQQLADGPVYLKPHNGESWVRLEISLNDMLARKLLVRLTNGEIPSARAWLVNRNGSAQPLYGSIGLNQPFNDRPVSYRHLVYPVFVSSTSEPQTLILRLEHFFSLKLNPEVYSEERFLHQTSREMIFFGMMYGAIAIIIIYNLFMYWSLREKSQLLYLLFGSLAGLFISMQEGHFYQFIGTGHLWPKETFYALVTALMCFSFTFFVAYFLDLQRRSTWMMRLLLSIGSVTALFLILLGINKQPVILSHYTLLIIIMLYFTGIAAALFVWYRHVSAAGFFTLAIFLGAAGMLLEFSAHLPFTPWAQSNYGFSSLGNAAMILIFAFALADKMRARQLEKLQSSIKMIKATEDRAHSDLALYKNKLQELQKENASNAAKIENRARSEFLATMSHEIRTPMNSVLGITELLEDTELDKKQRHYVNAINNAAKALLNVINDLLDYSRMQSGQMALDTRVLNLEKIIDDCVNIFSLRASEAKTSLIGLVDPSMPVQYKGDPDKLRQIILNLLSNAFNFSSHGDIAVHVLPTGRNTVNSMELRCEIRINGIALTDSDKKALFDPFTGSRQHGHELGLTVSRQLVELMQGEIGVDTDEEHASTTLWFTCRLILPRKNELLPLPDRSKLLSGRRMLICDSNPDFVEAIRTLTESWGMQVHAVSSSTAAGKCLLEDPEAYQVLMIGEEHLTPEVHLAIRQSNVDHNFITSIIVTTRTRFALSTEEMKKQGIQFILEKPYTTRQLYKALLHSMGIENRNIGQHKLPPPKALDVMIAEDNNINMMVIDGLLQKQQLHPVTARNGKQAVELFMQPGRHFDVIFMDCEMPEMDGYDATRAIREAEQNSDRHVVIIGLSAHAGDEHKQQALDAGMDDFIVKPVNRDYIENLVNSIRSGEFQQQFIDQDKE